MTVLLVLVMAVISGSVSDSIILWGPNFATPHYWSRMGILNVIQRGMGVEGILAPAGVLVGMAVIFFVIGARRFKYE